MWYKIYHIRYTVPLGDVVASPLSLCHNHTLNFCLIWHKPPKLILTIHIYTTHNPFTPFASENQVSPSSATWKNHIFTHVGETDSPKSTSEHPPKADSLLGRGSSLSPCPGCCCFLYLFKIPAPGAWPARPLRWCLLKPTGGQRGIVGRWESCSFPKLHQPARLLLAFFSPFLAFPCSAPTPFPCFFVVLLLLRFFLLFFPFRFFLPF